MNVASQNAIGSRQPRLEDRRLLRGEGCYVDDVAEPIGTSHLCFVMSPHAHARIKGIDTRAALNVDGVIEVLTGSDLVDLIGKQRADTEQPGIQSIERSMMTIDRVRFVGEPVAVVVAIDRYRAEDAAELVEVEYEPLAAVIEMDAASASDAIRLHDETTSNVLFQRHFKTEGFDEAYATADHIEAGRFQSSRLAAVSIEPRGYLAVFDAASQRLTVWSSTQIPHLVRTAISELIGVGESEIRVIAPDVGGGFGMKASVYPEEIIVAALAWRYRGAVKWICDRREDLLTSTHGRDCIYEISSAFRADGTLVAVKASISCNIGAYPSIPFGCSAEAGGAAAFLPGPYRMPHYAYDTRSVSTNTCPTGVYRAVAAPVAFFATEALMDRAARKLGLDPAEIRRKNILQPDEFPYLNAVGVEYDGGGYAKCFENALKAAGYEEFRASQPKDRLVDGKYRGIGIASIVEHTGQGSSRYHARGLYRIPGYDGAQVRIEPNGKVTAFVSECSQGQGHQTSFAQVVAGVLGLSAEDVMVVGGDTGQGPYGTGTFSSRGAVVAGGAALRATTVVANKVRRIAGELLEVSADDIELVQGNACVRGVSELKVSLQEIAAVAYGRAKRRLPAGESMGLEAIEYYDPPKVSITNATHVAEVSVDPLTGLVKIERYLAAHDAGRLINPMIVEGQFHGGVAQGIGSVLSEEISYDDAGQPMTVTLLDYLLPSTMDIPDIELLHEETWSKETVGGFKGVGEGGVIGAVPAVANAIEDALLSFDVRLERLPLRPGKVISMLEARQPR